MCNRKKDHIIMYIIYLGIYIDADLMCTMSNERCPVLCSPSKTQSDPSFGETGHIPVTGDNVGADTGLQKCCTGRPINVPCTATAVCTERCHTRDLSFHLRSADHITDALTTLHWLRVSERIE